MKTRLVSLFAFACMCFCSKAQSIQELMTRQQPDCRDVRVNASEVLPKLYAAKSFDSMQLAINLMKQFCGEATDDVFYLTTLLHIQQSTFSITEISEEYRFNRFLYNYHVDTTIYRYSGYRRPYYPFNEGWYDKLPLLIQAWARDLFSRPNLTNNESFVCNVLAGNFKNPTTTLQNEKEKYPELYSLLEKKYERDRVEGGGVFNVMLGIWIPTGNLKLVGVHPSFGLQWGGRGKKNEVLVTLQGRFLKSANLYTIRRSDSLYKLNHYFGGYIGLDYFHYFYHSTKFEAGVLAGAGYDGFDIASSDEDGKNDYLKPLTIGSLNVNAGIRANYFFESRLSIGVMARYNGVWYKNTGGSSLKGQPISIDFVVGR